MVLTTNREEDGVGMTSDHLKFVIYNYMDLNLGYMSLTFSFVSGGRTKRKRRICNILKIWEKCFNQSVH